MQRAPGRVAVIGAGPSGLAAARAMRDAGHEVVVYESQPGIGGVWAASREYPGLATQNTKTSYSYSDLAMPEEWPEQPTAAQMRTYLQRYAREHGVDDLLRLDHEVVRVDRSGTRWRVDVRHREAVDSDVFDAVVVAAGVLSRPHSPEWPGRAEFEAAGGRVLAPADLLLAETAGRRVVVIGWGKTACDLAVALQPLAASVTLVARSIRWKTPHRLGGLPLHELLMLSRTGEWLLYGQPGRLPAVAHRLTRVPPRLIRIAIAAFIARRLRLAALGVLPSGQLSEASSQITHGLLDAVRDGRIGVLRDVGVAELTGGAAPGLRLSDGTMLPADAVVLGTGYRLGLDPVAPELLDHLVDEAGLLSLRAFVHRDEVPGLYFVGWTQNISGLLVAEITALWAAAHLAGRLVGPGAPRRPLPGGAARLAAVPASSLTDLDRLLDDLGHPLPRHVRLAQWRGTLRREHYTATLDAVRRDLRPAAERASAPDTAARRSASPSR